ncbi:sigma-E factor negative regulatory protein [Alcaligenaceae bacterium]|nr:sigma-E factor negative regulatory protein [Alcaligenaceae bacterium]
MQAVKQVRPDHEDDAAWEACVSTWIDGEGDIRPEDLDSPYGRQVWESYHLIGDVLRNPDLAIKPTDFFYARLSKAIDAEPTILAPRNLHGHASMRVGLSGLAIAAAIATVVWVALPYFSGLEASAPAQVQVLASAHEDPGLRDYLEAHREISGSSGSAVRQVSFDSGVAR